jgi:hypothetical protein
MLAGDASEVAERFKLDRPDLHGAEGQKYLDRD